MAVCTLRLDFNRGRVNRWTSGRFVNKDPEVFRKTWKNITQRPDDHQFVLKKWLCCQVKCIIIFLPAFWPGISSPWELFLKSVLVRPLFDNIRIFSVFSGKSFNFNMKPIKLVVPERQKKRQKVLEKSNKVGGKLIIKSMWKRSGN